MELLLESIFEYLQIPDADANFYTTQLLSLGYDDPNSIADIDPTECEDFMKPGHRKRFAKYLHEISCDDDTGDCEKVRKDSVSRQSCNPASGCMGLDRPTGELNMFLLSTSVYPRDANVILKQIGNGNSARVYLSIFLPTLSLLAMKVVFTGSMKLATRLVDAELKVLNRLSKHSLVIKSQSDDFLQFEEDTAFMELSPGQDSEKFRGDTKSRGHAKLGGIDSAHEGTDQDSKKIEIDELRHGGRSSVEDAAIDHRQSNNNKFSRELVGHQSDYIIKFYDSYYDVRRKGVCLVMEYMSRGSLADLMRKGVIFSESMVAVVAYSILMALVDLHSLNMVHRDIKPENILCSADGRIKLADFGITGELMSASDQKKTFTGTIIYMSPERIKGEPHSYPSDVWGLGLSLLTLIRGSSPFSMQSFWGLVDEICSRDIFQESDLASSSPELISFLRAALHIEADQRSSAAELLQHPFIQNAINSGVISPPQPPCLHNLKCEDVVADKNLWKMVEKISKWRVEQPDLDWDSIFTSAPIVSSKGSTCASPTKLMPVQDIMRCWDRFCVLKLAQDFQIDVDKLVVMISKSVNDAISRKANFMEPAPLKHSIHAVQAAYSHAAAPQKAPHVGAREVLSAVSQPELRDVWEDAFYRFSGNQQLSKSDSCELWPDAISPMPMKFWDNLDDDMPPNHQFPCDVEYKTPLVRVTHEPAHEPMDSLLALEWEDEQCKMEPLTNNEQHRLALDHSNSKGHVSVNENLGMVGKVGGNEQEVEGAYEEFDLKTNLSGESRRCPAAANLRIDTRRLSGKESAKLPEEARVTVGTGADSNDNQEECCDVPTELHSTASLTGSPEDWSHATASMGFNSGTHVASSDTRDRRGGESPCHSSRPSHLGSSHKGKRVYILPMHETCKLLQPYWTYRSPTPRGHSRLLRRVKSGTGLAESVDHNQCCIYEELFPTLPINSPTNSQEISPQAASEQQPLQQTSILSSSSSVPAATTQSMASVTNSFVQEDDDSSTYSPKDSRAVVWKQAVAETDSQHVSSTARELKSIVLQPHPSHGPSYLIPHEVGIDDGPTAVPSHLLPTSQPPRNALPPASVLAFIFSPQEIGRGGTFPGYVRVGNDSTEPKDLKQPSARTARVTELPRSTRSHRPSYAGSTVRPLSSSVSSPLVVHTPAISAPASVGQVDSLATSATTSGEVGGAGCGYYAPTTGSATAIPRFNRIASWPDGFSNFMLKPHADADADGEQDIRVDCLHKTQPSSSIVRISSSPLLLSSSAAGSHEGGSDASSKSSGDETVDGLDTLVLQSPAGVGVKEMLERCSSLRYLGLDDDRVPSSLSMDTLSSQSPPADATKEADMPAVGHVLPQIIAAITLNNAASMPPHGSFILIGGEPLVRESGLDGVSCATVEEDPDDADYEGITF